MNIHSNPVFSELRWDCLKWWIRWWGCIKKQSNAVYISQSQAELVNLTEMNHSIAWSLRVNSAFFILHFFIFNSNYAWLYFTMLILIFHVCNFFLSTSRKSVITIYKWKLNRFIKVTARKLKILFAKLNMSCAFKFLFSESWSHLFLWFKATVVDEATSFGQKQRNRSRNASL